MPQGLVQGADARCWSRAAAEQDNEAPDEYWPEVSTRFSRENPAPLNPENAPSRVFFEIFVVLAVAAALIVAVGVLLPAGLAQ